MNSTNGLTNFYAKLKEKISGRILNDLFQFINVTFGEICGRIKNVEDISIVVQDFIYKKSNEFAKLWEFDFTNSKLYYNEICEGFESLVIKSLYNQIMSLMQVDGRFDKLKRKFSFVSLSNLRCDFQVDDFELANQIKSKSDEYNC